ncbi:unnamed protein product [Bursaphelenchus okinawaensis]|uniref:Uncharacterized protein n=1 Tax=Bursaphelenchus okinawaensis TaxID=465554 RepID=A0A811L0F5_9BILA|nr:unnamed protein product [Bursaphelenchus okinawaensis]CAG9115429.1 unnamed protein product [Bursaphelenchus okinawaensis]
MKKIGQMNRDIWDIIMKHCDMSSITNLARIKLKSQKIINFDFKKVCVRNHIYRLPGELWADAFADVHRRLWKNSTKLWIGVFFGYMSHFVMFAKGKVLVVCSMDFARPLVKVFRYQANVINAVITSDQNYVVVSTDNGQSFVNDLKSNQPLSTDQRTNIKFNASVFTHDYNCTFIQDVLSTKKISIENIRTNIIAIRGYYVACVEEDKLAIHDVNSALKYEVPLNQNYSYIHYVTLLTSTNCVKIVYGNENSNLSPFEMYNIENGSLLFSDIDDCDVLTECLVRCHRGFLYSFDSCTGTWVYAGSTMKKPHTILGITAPDFSITENYRVPGANLERRIPISSPKLNAFNETAIRDVKDYCDFLQLHEDREEYNRTHDDKLYTLDDYVSMAIDSVNRMKKGVEGDTEQALNKNVEVDVEAHGEGNKTPENDNEHHGETSHDDEQHQDETSYYDDENHSKTSQDNEEHHGETSRDDEKHQDNNDATKENEIDVDRHSEAGLSSDSDYSNVSVAYTEYTLNSSSESDDSKDSSNREEDVSETALSPAVEDPPATEEDSSDSPLSESERDSPVTEEDAPEPSLSNSVEDLPVTEEDSSEPALSESVEDLSVTENSNTDDNTQSNKEDQSNDEEEPLVNVDDPEDTHPSAYVRGLLEYNDEDAIRQLLENDNHNQAEADDRNLLDFFVSDVEDDSPRWTPESLHLELDPNEHEFGWQAFEIAFLQEKPQNKMLVQYNADICRTKHPLVELSQQLMFHDVSGYSENIAAIYYQKLVDSWCYTERYRSFK